MRDYHCFTFYPFSNRLVFWIDSPSNSAAIGVVNKSVCTIYDNINISKGGD